MSLWSKISNLGISDNEEIGKKSYKKLTNRLILFTFTMATLYVPLSLIIKLKKGYIPSIMFPIVIGSLFFLVRLKKFQLATVLLILFSACQMVLVANMAPNGYLHLFLFPVFIFNLALIRNIQIKVILGVIIIGFFFLSEYYQLGFKLRQSRISEIEYTFYIVNNFMVFFTSIYTIFHFKKTNNEYEKGLVKQKIKIEAHHQELNRMHYEIKSSIAYAKRIQQAILPSQKMVQQYLKKSFIIYKPKENIAGDFYWTEVLDDSILFAVADCTGHGVPGAMISVVCHNALNRSVREFKLSDPAEILEKTREIVISEFEYSGHNMMDGMDIALVKMPIIESVKEITIEFAGANCPLYTVSEGNLTMTHADKQPIGQYNAQFPFTTKRISVKKNDMIYIFTDGYVSQFGGDIGKKLKYKPFRRLLSSVSHLRQEDQSQKLLQSFNIWKGDYEQVDDICIMGVRV